MKFGFILVTIFVLNVIFLQNTNADQAALDVAKAAKEASGAQQRQFGVVMDSAGLEYINKCLNQKESAQCYLARIQLYSGTAIVKEVSAEYAAGRLSVEERIGMQELANEHFSKVIEILKN